jgi:3-deoxy-manno-octulosonate cytidylyltransferase (CMP-KDO synthetase)
VTASSENQTAAANRDKAVLVLPARLASTRLKNKLLLSETGKPLLAHSIARALEIQAASNGRITRLLVATDDQALLKVAQAAGAQGIMTDPAHQSGTDRIAEAVADLPEKLIINLQADEPEIPPGVVLRLMELMDSQPQAQMATLASPLFLQSEVMNPNIVKVVIDENQRALYFSRSAIPFARDGWPPEKQQPTKKVLGLRHIGLYAYRKSFLLSYPQLPPSTLEQTERLEQLRALQAGHTIACTVVEPLPEGIDTREGYQAFVERVRAIN